MASQFQKLDVSFGLYYYMNVSSNWTTNMAFSNSWRVGHFCEGFGRKGRDRQISALWLQTTLKNEFGITRDRGRKVFPAYVDDVDFLNTKAFDSGLVEARSFPKALATQA